MLIRLIDVSDVQGFGGRMSEKLPAKLRGAGNFTGNVATAVLDSFRVTSALRCIALFDSVALHVLG